MLRIPEDSRAPRRAVISAGNLKNIGTFRLNLHLSSGSRMDMSLKRKLSSVNCRGLAKEFSKLHIAHRALATLLALVLLFSAYPQSLVAQEQPGPLQAPSGPPYQEQTPEQLQELVAPIALYPDSLVAQILAAGPDVGLTACACGLENVYALSSSRRRQVCGRVLDCAPIHGLPSHPNVLDHVLGFSNAPEHTVSDAKQTRTHACED
jgi:Protein of unknown function (DUF3300)